MMAPIIKRRKQKGTFKLKDTNFPKEHKCAATVAAMKHYGVTEKII